MPVYQRKCQTCKKPCKHKKVWYYDFCIRYKRYTRAIPEARTKWQAERAEAKAKEEVYQGKYGKEPSNVPLKNFIEKVYLPWSKQEKRSWRNDESRSKALIAYFKTKRMREIVQLNVKAFKKERLNSLTERGGFRAPASVDRELQLLSRIFSLAIERGLVNDNPCKGVKLCGVGNTIIQYLTEDEEARLKPFLTGRRKHLLDILEIDLHTGMRRTELLSLHQSQVDFVRGSILLTHTKNGKSRTIPIHAAIEPTLRRLCEEAGPSGYLFENSRTGKPIRDIKTAWRKALELAEIPHIPFHCAGRHTFGTRAAEGGASLKDIQEVMDHADIKTTMRYVHATEQGKRRAVEAAAKRRQPESVATVLRQKKRATA